MKHALRWLSIVFASCVVVPAFARPSGVTADVVFEHDAARDRLVANFRLHGIAAGDTFRYTVTWGEPEVVYRTKKGEVITLWGNTTTYSPEKPAGDTSCAKCRCYCADTKERGCWRTWAYRTLSFKSEAGKVFRAVGTWKVRISRNDTGEVLGEGEYVVE